MVAFRALLENSLKHSLSNSLKNSKAAMLSALLVAGLASAAVIDQVAFASSSSASSALSPYSMEQSFANENRLLSAFSSSENGFEDEGFWSAEGSLLAEGSLPAEGSLHAEGSQPIKFSVICILLSHFIQ